MRKLQLAAALSAALEDNELFPVVTAETTSEVEETLIEMDESYDEARDAVEVVEELEERGEQVEELVEAVESFIGQGGMSPEGAQIYYMQLERLGRGLESLHGNDLSVSTESYAARDRMSASLEAKEKGENFAKKIWASIVAMARAAWDAIANFLGKLLNSNASLKKQVKALREKVKDLRGKEIPSGTKFGSGAWARNLSKGSNGIDPAQTASVVGDFAQAMATASGGLKVVLGKGIYHNISELQNTITKVGEKLPGSYSVEATETNFAVVRKDVHSPSEIAPLDSSQIESVLGSVSSLLDNMDAFTKDVNAAIKKLNDEVVKKSKENAEDDKKATKQARSLIAMVQKTGLSLPRIGSDIARSAIVYCNKSVSAHKEKAK